MDRMSRVKRHKEAGFQRIYDRIYCEELLASDFDVVVAEERADARFLSAFATWDSYRASPEQS